MLNILLEKVCYLIVKAREFDAKEEVVEPNPGSNPSDDKDVEVLEDYPEDPTYEELVGAIEGLNEDEQLDLVALTWIGRGDFSADQWDDARGQAAEITDKHIASYLVGTPQLGDLLEEGLAAFDLSCADFDKEHL